MTFRELRVGERFAFVPGHPPTAGPWLKTGERTFRHAADPRRPEQRVATVKAEVLRAGG